MRRGVFALSVVLAVAGATNPALAGPSETPMIVVVGHGMASAPADFAQIDFAVRGEGKSSVDALHGLAERRAAVESNLGTLAGTTGVKLASPHISVSEARSPACRDTDYPNSHRMSGGDCVVVGYVAELNESVTIFPAEKAGNAASLAVELGATNVNLETADVRDPGALRSAATKAAVEDAQRQASLVAAASGGHLGPIIRIQDNETRDSVTTVNEFVVTAQKRVASNPSVPIDFKPSPISKTAEFTVTYSLIQ